MLWTAHHRGWVSVVAGLLLNGLIPGTGLAEPAAWHDPNLVADLSYGIYCNRPPDSLSVDEDTIKGAVGRYSANPTLVRKTQTIPAIDDLLFGVIGREQPPSAANVTIVVDHPPLGPEGNTRESWVTQMNGNHPTFHGYYFDLIDGNPVGAWTITGTRGRKTLFKVQFDVVRPTTVDVAEQKLCELGQVS